MKYLLTLTSVALMFGITSTKASDWPQFRGAEHNSTTSDKVATTWPKDGPHQLWKYPLHGGFSSITVGNGRAYTMDLREQDGVDWEACVALDANTGKELWVKPLGVANYIEKRPRRDANSGTEDNNGGDGPRSTPSIDGERVYVMTGNLVLFCLDAKTGNQVWKVDLIREHEGKNIGWKNAASPLIDGDLIFVAGGGPGQALMSIDKKDGQVVWKGEDDMMTHSTPTSGRILGVRQVIFFTQKGLVSVEAKTGKVLWRYPFRYSVSTGMTPVIAGDIVYCSAGYGVGAGACKITKSGDDFTASQLWFQPAKVMNNHWSTPVYKDGYLYGLFGFKEYGKCPLKCVQVATGNVIWSEEGFGPGGTILAGDKLVVLGDSGQVVLVEPNSKKYIELARTQALQGKCWSTPIVSNGRIYARSTKEAVCLDVKP